MKITKLVFASAILFSITSANAATCPSSGCGSDWLNVPGDFVNPFNSFTMNLLGGWFAIDYEDPANPGNWIAMGDSTTTISTLNNQINFTATQFNHIGPGQGTSVLNASLNHLIIGTADFFGNPTTIYADGQATGTLVDTANSTQGNWTLNTHLYADWGLYNSGIDLGLFSLSSNSSYSFSTNSDFFDVNVSGTIMDYHTGLTNLVGQGIIQDGPIPGYRVTIGFQGQDPVAAPVPLPAAAWLLGSGILGLIGVARRKAA